MVGGAGVEDGRGTTAAGGDDGFLTTRCRGRGGHCWLFTCKIWVFRAGHVAGSSPRRALACLATPLFAGQLADRRIPTQRLLGLIYAIGAVLLTLLALGLVTEAGAAVRVLSGVLAGDRAWVWAEQFGGVSKLAKASRAVRGRAALGHDRLDGRRVAGDGGLVGRPAAGGVTRRAGGRDGFHDLGALLSAIFASTAFGRCRIRPRWVASTGAGGRESRRSQVRGGLLLFQGETAAFLAIAFGVSLTMPFIYQTVPAVPGSGGLAPSLDCFGHDAEPGARDTGPGGITMVSPSIWATSRDGDWASGPGRSSSWCSRPQPAAWACASGDTAQWNRDRGIHDLGSDVPGQQGALAPPGEHAGHLGLC